MDKRSTNALKQFKELVGKLPKVVEGRSTTQPEPEDRGSVASGIVKLGYDDDGIESNADEPEWDAYMENIQETTKEYEEKGVMVNITENTKQMEVINGLSPIEIRDLRGVLLPSDTVDMSTRLGPKGTLQTQADYFSESIGYTERRLDEVNDELNEIMETHADGEELIKLTKRQLELEETRDLLEERIKGLKEARELTIRQRESEETKSTQEGDISRLQKFKEWAKENMVGLSALAIGIAGLITTIIIAARKAVLTGAQGVNKFAKAVAKLGKKLWPLLAPIFSIISQILSWGARGLAFLAKNLWVLAIVFAWFVYDQYKERRRNRAK